MNESLKAYLEDVRDLPLMPEVAHQVVRATEDPGFPLARLRALIERDPAIVGRLLKVSNSSLYGFARQIGTLDHAIALMGMRTVKNLVLALSLKDVFKRFGLMEKLLLQHCSMGGPAAACLGEYLELDARSEELFVAGLLHDVGKIALVNSHRSEYEQIVMRVSAEGVSFCEAERETFGFDHAELGGEIARKWRLSQHLEAAIRWHHCPAQWETMPDGDRLLTMAIALTTACLSRLGVGRQRPVADLSLASLPEAHELGLSQDREAGLISALSETLKKAEGLFA